MGEIENVTRKIRDLDDLKDLDMNNFVKFEGDADKLTQDLKENDIKTTQLRKFFAAVKSIELEVNANGWNEKYKREFTLLMPKLAYAKSRKLINQNFYNLMEVSMSKVNNENNKIMEENFKTFVEFLEAIVAYFKANNS